jgi:hypothetical protein
MPGTWEVEIQLPSGEEAREASEIEALTPAVLSVFGHDVLVEGFRTSDATVIRYVLPPGISETHPPSLAANGLVIGRGRAERVAADAPTEVSFDPTPFGSAISVRFDGLLGVVPNQSEVELSLTLQPHDVPSFTTSDALPQQQGLEWNITTADTAAPKVSDVSWMREGVDRTTIRITVAGTWIPSAGSKPRVVSNGVELFVTSVINYDATPDRGDETVVVAELPDGALPRNLTMDIMGASQSLGFAELTLEP